MKTSPLLTCAILARNVAEHIGPCIDSCRFADEIIVFDTASSDGTQDRARAAGARVIDTPFVNFSQARNFALEHSTGEWVLFVDADERVTPELAAEVRDVIRRQDVAGWWVPRYNHIVGHVMKGAGWYPDYQLRLLRRGRAHYDPRREVHEVAIVDGAEGHLSHHLIHYNYDSWQQFHEKQRRYTAYEAATLRHQGVTFHPRHLFVRPLQAFWRRFVVWHGYRDGWHGLRLSLIMAWYEGLKYWWFWRGGP
ncbi:MAG: glycosyltransferase family 2 protein [Chloroflexi bacterium]|nr:MAG: glycosyltransferase family 2 protein [Chloroflexota bacterium]